MILSTLLVAFTGVLIASGPEPGDRELALGSVRRVFPQSTEVKETILALRQSEKDSLRRLAKQGYNQDSLVVLVPFRQATVLGYAVVDHVKGKDQFITYIITVDPGLAVKDLEILVYREPYGGEVRNTLWREQFYGKRPGDAVRPGREIKNISGATISVRSVTYGVQKILALLHIVQERLPHTPTPGR